MDDRAEKCAEPKDAKYWLKAYKRPILQRMMYSDALSGEDLALLLEEFAEFRSHYPDDRELLEAAKEILLAAVEEFGAEHMHPKNRFDKALERLRTAIERRG